MKYTTKHKNTDGTTTELLTKATVAKRLKLCERKVELMVNAKEIPVIKIGASVRFNWTRVIEALENNQPNN